MSEDVTPYGGQKEPDNQARVDEARALAEMLGWSQREVARRLECDDRDVREWFSGKVPMPAGVLYALRYCEQYRGETARVADARG